MLKDFPLVFLLLRCLCSCCPVAGFVPQPHILAVSRAPSVAPHAEVQLLIPTQMSLQWDPWCCPKTDHHHWQMSKAWLDGMAKVTKPHNFFFLGTDSVLVKGKERPVESLNETTANSALFQHLACLSSEELFSTGRNERQNYGLLCSENGGKTLGLETAHQWQRSFFKRNNKSISGWKA